MEIFFKTVSNILSKSKRNLLLLAFIFIPFGVGAYTFNQNLTVGTRHPDVKELQKELNKRPETRLAENGIGSIGNETDFFGTLTRDAVVRYQNLYAKDILMPIGLSFGTGYFGKSTREHMNTNVSINFGLNTNLGTNMNLDQTTIAEQINKSINNKPIVTSTTPTITSITPSDGTSGEEVVIIGKNFSDSNTVFLSFDPASRYKDIPSDMDGTRIVFEVDSDISRAFNKQIEELDSRGRQKVYDEFAPIDLGLSVFNENGISNIVSFTLHMR